MTRHLLFTVCAWAGLLFPAGAQTVVGEASVPVVNVSPEQARARAVRLAKEQALQRAVGEEARTTESLLSGGGEQLLGAFSSIESRGGIVGVEMLEDRLIATGGVPCYRVRLRASVQRYATVADPAFGLRVDGVRATGYRSGEPLTFTLTPTDSCYLNIFLFDDGGAGTQLYPNASELSRPFRGGEVVTFPTNRAIQYTLMLDDPRLSEEINTLLVVQTKRRAAFTAPTTDYETVAEWLSRIEPGERHVPTFPVRIVSTKH